MFQCSKIWDSNGCIFIMSSLPLKEDGLTSPSILFFLHPLGWSWCSCSLRPSWCNSLKWHGMGQNKTKAFCQVGALNLGAWSWEAHRPMQGQLRGNGEGHLAGEASFGSAVFWNCRTSTGPMSASLPGKSGKITSKPVRGRPGPSKSRAVFMTGTVFKLGAVPCWEKAKTLFFGRCTDRSCREVLVVGDFFRKTWVPSAWETPPAWAVQHWRFTPTGKPFKEGGKVHWEHGYGKHQQVKARS